MSFLSRLKAAWEFAGMLSEANTAHRVGPAPEQKSLHPFFRPGADLGGVGPKLTEPYKQSAPVMRALKLVSQPICSVPLRFTQDARGGKKLVENPELAAWWEAPAIGADKQPMSQADFFEASTGWLKLKGESFWLIDDTIFAKTSSLPFPEAGLTFPRLLVARPDRMRPLKLRSGELLAWEFTDGAGQRFNFEPMQVVHLRFWNPTDDHRGLGEVEAARVDAESDYLAGLYKRNLWRGNGDRGPIISVKNAATLDDKQRDQLIAQFREKREMAARGIFKAAVIGGDVSVEDPKAQSVDAAFIASRAEDITRIFLALGVPPSMATVTASYSIGAASDWYRLIIDTCMPAGKKLSEGIERVLKLQMGAGTSGAQSLFAWFDWRAHPVMQQVRKESVDAGAKLWERGMPWDQVSEWLALDLPSFPGSDTGFLPYSVTPVGSDGLPSDLPPEKDPALDEPQDDSGNAAEKLQRLFRTRAKQTDSFALIGTDDHFYSCVSLGEQMVRQKGRSPQEVALWKTHMAKRRAVLRRYEAAFNRVLLVARAKVLNNISAKLESTKSAVTRAAAADFLFDLNSFKSGLLASMRKAGTAALLDAGQQFFAEIKKDDPFRYPPAKAVEFLRDRENKLSGIPRDVFERIEAALQVGLDKGESVDKLSDRIRSEFNGLSKERARVIAMTETAAAYGAARQEAMEQSGVEYKKWLTSGAANVRPAHAAANGQTVRVGESFEVGGESLEGPGDPNGSPGNVINCHCVAIAVAAPEEET